MNKKYVTPITQIVRFLESDVITASQVETIGEDRVASFNAGWLSN